MKLGNYSDKKENNTQEINTKKLMKLSAFMFFLWATIYYTPAYINTLREKKIWKIKHVDTVTTKNITDIFTLMNYDQESRVLLGSDENYVDMWHSNSMKTTSNMILDNLLLLEHNNVLLQDYNWEDIHNIKAWRASWHSCGQVHSHNNSCKISANIVDNIAKNLWISIEETYSMLSLLLSLSLWEQVEKEQAANTFVEWWTKSWWNRNDLNGNILWAINWINTYKDKKYYITRERVQEIIHILQNRYKAWNSNHYLRWLSKDFWFTVIRHPEEI